MDRRIEFLVKGIVAGASGRVGVIGRCCEEGIRVGDAFTFVYRRARHQSTQDTAADPVDGKSVSIRVDAVHAYEHDLQELGMGMTGTLYLTGSGLALIAPGWSLGSAPCATTESAVQVEHETNLSS